ncbi:MAG: L-seryl-tRNA(Sec) selenium transferase [Methanosarcina sp.]|nr:L-seryl-tRNA(Sec) selenium transferase [Methanosarcina sp.]
MDKKKELLKRIPKIDEVLKDQRLFVFFENTARGLIVESVREITDEARNRILCWSEGEPPFPDFENMINDIIDRIYRKRQRSLRRVINGTGTILHTNLGRARLSKETCKNIEETATNYSTLEYDLKLGNRGSRHDHIEKLITKITGTQAAMVVNNNAAALLLCLSELAEGKDVIVSRGELVEIGGSFRIPEIMKLGGARLVEVGTTNKTKIDDYRNAVIDGQTAILLKVHTSNYKIMGFTADTSLAELVELGQETKIPVVYDLGSGLLIDLQKYGIDEPTVIESLKPGIDLIMFSGDKLLGGPQAGIITGKKEYIDRMKKHPLARVVRTDKMTLAALEATFCEYLDLEKAKESIPVLSMITVPIDEMRNKATLLAERIRQATDAFDVEVARTEGQIGGGSTPNLYLPGYGVAIKGREMSLDRIERDLRSYQVPVIVRIYQERILIDMRTVEEEDLETVAKALLWCKDKYDKGKKRDE